MRSFQPMDYDPWELQGVTIEEITRRRQIAKLRSHPTATIQRAATKAAIHFRPLQYFCSQDEYTVFFFDPCEASVPLLKHLPFWDVLDAWLRDLQGTNNTSAPRTEIATAIHLFIHESHSRPSFRPSLVTFKYHSQLIAIFALARLNLV